MKSHSCFKVANILTKKLPSTLLSALQPIVRSGREEEDEDREGRRRRESSVSEKEAALDLD